MSLRKLIDERKKNPVVELQVQGLGPVRVKRTATGAMLSWAKLDKEESTLQMVLESIVDEKDQPVFKDRADVSSTDWAIVTKLVNAAKSVNELKVEDAAKN